MSGIIGPPNEQHTGSDHQLTNMLIAPRLHLHNSTTCSAFQTTRDGRIVRAAACGLTACTRDNSGGRPVSILGSGHENCEHYYYNKFVLRRCHGRLAVTPRGIPLHEPAAGSTIPSAGPSSLPIVNPMPELLQPSHRAYRVVLREILGHPRLCGRFCLPVLRHH